MYILVDSVLTSERGEVADVTMAMIMPFAVGDEVVRVQRNHPLRHGVIVVDTKADVLPTTPVEILKLANKVEYPRAAI